MSDVITKVIKNNIKWKLILDIKEKVPIMTGLIVAGLLLLYMTMTKDLMVPVKIKYDTSL